MSKSSNFEPTISEFTSWQELLEDTKKRLSSTLEDSARFAELVCFEVSGFEGPDFVGVKADPVTEKAVAKVDSMIERLNVGEPLQYVLGSWSFRNIDLFVDKRVLIPRPETEMVAGHAIDIVNKKLADSDGVSVLDLGAGSGAIGLSVAFECPGTGVTLVDSSDDALAVARANLAGIGRAGTNVTLLQGDWFASLDSQLRNNFDVIVSNPPYCANTDEFGKGVLEHEPYKALVADDDGYKDLFHIIENAPKWLKQDGVLVLEFGLGQETKLAEKASQFFKSVEVHNDFTDRPRCLVASIVL